MDSSSASQVFSGLRVVELGDSDATSLATVIMADNGAEVIKLESPEASLGRSNPGSLMWNRGKKSIVCDLNAADGAETARELVRTADVVVAAFLRPETGGGLEALCRSLTDAPQGLVFCSLSAFGLARQCEHLVARAEIVEAKSGRLHGNDAMSGALQTERPIFLTSRFTPYGAALLALQGIVAALYARANDGHGQCVETSLLDGLVCATMRLGFERRGNEVVSTKDRAGGTTLTMRKIALCFISPRCKDGRYIQMCARQDLHFSNWLRALELDELLQDERFKNGPLRIPTDADLDFLEAVIRARMATRTQQEWMTLFMTRWDVGSDPFLSPDEFLRHPQMVLNGRTATIHDPSVGPVRQLGPLVQFSQTPSQVGAAAPLLGQHQDELPRLLGRIAPRLRSRPAHGAGRAPFEGLLIIELASYLATPMGATLLAELGARVIKVEPLEGDSFRRVGLESVHLLHGKESLPIDLKKPQGQEILRRLVLRADALVHNFRPGVPERLGIGYEELHAVNDRLIYLYGASYGSQGPERNRPAFHSTPHALCGGGILQGGLGNPPVDDSYPDPCSGMAVAAALSMGFLARLKTGKGQYLETTMLTSSGYVHADRLTLFKNMPPPQSLDAGQQGFSALNRLYRAKDGWVMLSVLQQQEWLALCSALEPCHWASDTRFASAAQRELNDDALIGSIQAEFERHDSAWLEAQMSRCGVPLCALSDSFEQFVVDHGLARPGEYPGFGQYWRVSDRIRFSRSTNIAGPPCRLGEHTMPLLAELGYSRLEIEQLIGSGTVIAMQ